MSFWDDFAKEQAQHFENLPKPEDQTRRTLAADFEVACKGFARLAEMSGFSPDVEPPNTWESWYTVSAARDTLFGAHYGLSTINPNAPIDDRGFWRLAGAYSVLYGRHFADGGEQSGDVNQYTWSTAFWTNLADVFPITQKLDQHALAKKYIQGVKAIFERDGIKTVITDETLDAEADHFVRWFNFLKWLRHEYVVGKKFFTETSFHRDVAKFGIETLENGRRFDLTFDGKYLGDSVFDLLDALRQLPAASYVPKSPTKPTLDTYEALGAMQDIFAAVDQHMVPIAERSVIDRLAAAIKLTTPPNDVDLQPSDQRPLAATQPAPAAKYVKPRGLTKDETNIEVRKYLRKHRGAKVREIVEGVNALIGPARHTSIGQVQQSIPWKAEKARRDAQRKGRSVKTIGLTRNLASVVGVVEPDLAQAIEDQACDFEPSPLDRTRHRVRAVNR